MALRDSYLDQPFQPQAQNFQLPQTPVQQEQANVLPPSKTKVIPGILGWLDRTLLRGGGLRPGRDNDTINSYAQMIQTGALNDQQIEAVKERNPDAATIFSQAQFVNRQRVQVQQITKQYANDLAGMINALRQSGNYDLAQKIEAQKHQEEMEQLAQERESRLQDDLKETPFVKELRSAGIKEGSSEWNKLIRAHLAKMDAPSVTQIVSGSKELQGATAEQLHNMGWQDIIRKTKVPLSEMAFKDASFQYAITGKMPPTGWGTAGMPMRIAYEEGRAKIAADYGMSPEEMATMPSKWKAEATNLNKLTTKRGQLDAIMSSFHNNIATFESVAQGRPPQLSGDRIKSLGNAFKAIDFTDVNALNKAQIEIKRQFNDPATVAYITSAVTVAMDYARILSSQGQSAAQVTDSARTEALNLINVGYNANARQALIGVLESDTAGQLKGLNDSISRTQNRMQNLQSDTNAPTVQPDNDPLGIRK